MNQALLNTSQAAPVPAAGLSLGRIWMIQFLGLVGMVIAFGLCLLLSELTNRLNVSPDSEMLNVIAILMIGAGVGLVEYPPVKPWIDRPAAVWAAGTMIALLTAGLVAFGLFQYPFPQLQSSYASLSPSVWDQIDPWLIILRTLYGALVGLPCGLIFGLGQSMLLKIGRRRWWLVSVVLWVLVLAVVGMLSGQADVIVGKLWRPI